MAGGDRLASAEASYRARYPANPRDWICLAHVVAAVAHDMTEEEAATLAPQLRKERAAASYVYGKDLPAPAIRRLLRDWRRIAGSDWVRFVVDAVPADAADASLRGAWHDAMVFLELCESDFSLRRLKKLGARETLRFAVCGWVERMARTDMRGYALLSNHGGPECVAALQRAHERSLSDPFELGALRAAFERGKPGSPAMAELASAVGRTLVARLMDTPLATWREALGLGAALDALSFSLSMAGAALSARADNLEMDRLRFALSIQSWPAEWCRIELIEERNEQPLLCVRNDEVTFSWEQVGLDPPTLHGLPAWLRELTREFEIRWEPMGVGGNGRERDRARVRAWLEGRD